MFIDFNNIILYVVFEVIIVIALIISYLKNRRKERGRKLFVESLDIYKRAIHLAGISLLLVYKSVDLTEKYIDKNGFVVMIHVVFMFLLLLYFNLSRRVIVTTEGIGYIYFLKIITSFTHWKNITGFELEGLEFKIFLSGSRESKTYYVDLSDEAKTELRKIVLENIEDFV
jgi:hypothetical protein